MKKAFRFFLAMMTASALFLGCGTDDDDSGNENEEEDTSVAELNAALESAVGTYYNDEVTSSYYNHIERHVVKISKSTEQEGTFTIRTYEKTFWNRGKSNESSRVDTDKTDTFTAVPFSKLSEKYVNTNYKASNTKNYDYSFGYEIYYDENGQQHRTNTKSEHYNLRNNGDGTINFNSYSFTPKDEDYSDYFYDWNLYKKISDGGFDFETGELTDSSSGDDEDTGSLPSDFDITASTWTYTGTAGSVSITYTVKFSSDKTVTVTKSGKSQASGTWSLSGSTLTLVVKNSSTEATDKFTLSGGSSSLTLTLSGDSSYTTGSSSYTTSDYSMALTVMFMASSKTATLTSSD